MSEICGHVCAAGSERTPLLGESCVRSQDQSSVQRRQCGLPVLGHRTIHLASVCCGSRLILLVESPGWSIPSRDVSHLRSVPDNAFCSTTRMHPGNDAMRRKHCLAGDQFAAVWVCEINALIHLLVCCLDLRVCSAHTLVFLAVCICPCPSCSQDQ